jgi:hypothetical protein
MIFYKIYYNFKLLLIISVLFLAPFSISYSQSSIINYIGGIGEFEVSYPNFNSFFGNKLNNQKISIGLYQKNLDAYGIKSEFDLDTKEKFSGKSSQKISIFKEPGEQITENPQLQFIIPGSGNLSINPENKDYYPKPGDTIEASLFLKSSSLENIGYRLTLSAIYSSGTKNYQMNIHQTSFEFQSTNWAEKKIYNITIPYLQNYPDLNFLYFKVEFVFPNSSTVSKGIFWLDNAKFYVKRNNNYITWPNKLNSSLKFFEVFRNYYSRDFIELYKKTQLHFSIYPEDIIIKSYDPSYKILLYTHPIVMLKNYDLEKGGWARESSIINEFIDDLSFITSGECKIANFYFHPNANYPELLKIDTSTQNYPYKYKSNCSDNAYQGIKTLYSHPFLLDIYSKTLINIKDYFLNQNLKPDAIYLDAIAQGSDDLSVQTPDILSIKRSYFQLLSFLHNKISPLFKIIGNLGYLPYSSINNVQDFINFYSIRKFLNGYLDEGWLLSPYTRSLSHYPSRTHQIFKTAIENQNYDYILIVGAALGDNCNENIKLKNYIISSFYLINNPNTYFALTPLPDFIPKRYALPQCYEPSMYLPLGNPKTVSGIEELVVTSTLNYSKGALYKREYDNGLILLNSSNDLIFSYYLSTTTFPDISSFIDQYGNIYNLPTLIEIPTTTGLILYKSLSEQ